MAVVFLHVGQAGNQIGEGIWSLVSKEPAAKKSLCDGSTAQYRAVFADTEPKVIDRLTRNLGSDRVNDSNAYYEQSGRGNCWALGYNGGAARSEDGERERIVDKVSEKVRHLAERMDRYSGCVLTHSLAGGTGSGLGSKLVEVMRDDYPDHHIMSMAVSPFTSGETPLQAYNSLLTLSYLQEYTDAICLFQNQELLSQLGGGYASTTRNNSSDPAQRQSSSSKKVSLFDINRHICHSICGVIFPTKRSGATAFRKGSAASLVDFDIHSYVYSVCPNPTLKFSQVHTSVPPTVGATVVKAAKKTQVDPNWDSILNNLISQSRSQTGGVGVEHRQGVDGVDHLLGGRNVAIASQLYVRGDVSLSFVAQPVYSRFQRHFKHVEWNPFPLDSVISPHPAFQSLAAPASLTLCSNRIHIIRYLQQVRDAARIKFHGKAYLHVYQRHGCEEEMFQEAFEVLDKVIDNYKLMAQETRRAP